MDKVSIEKFSCSDFESWRKAQPDQSPKALWETCPRGSWMLGYLERTGTSFDTLTPVVYRAVNRALVSVSNSLNVIGIPHTLHNYKVTDKKSANVVASAATWIILDVWDSNPCVACKLESLAQSCREAQATFWITVGVAESTVNASANVALYESKDAWAAEHLQCANDCRELLSLPDNLK